MFSLTGVGRRGIRVKRVFLTLADENEPTFVRFHALPEEVSGSCVTCCREARSRGSMPSCTAVIFWLRVTVFLDFIMVRIVRVVVPGFPSDL
jgi:hypothetical protein